MISDSDVSKVNTVAIIGASGFVGEQLLNVLSKQSNIEIRILVHHTRTENHSNFIFIEGDLLKSDSLDELLSKNCMVINLAYLPHKNIEALANLARACAKNKIRRLIHCSTAVVAGRVKTNLVTENTPCNPVSEYEKTKLCMEKKLLEIAQGKFETVILRPSAIFGFGGKNLLKLSDELAMKSMWVSYLKSCLFNHRSMNLVSVDNVVAALVFLLTVKEINSEIFIISDDDFAINNYRDIEDRLLSKFDKSYPFPRIYIPKFILSILLRITGKSNINPLIKYSDKKLAALGFNKPKNLGVAIDDFATWYKNSHII